MAADRTPLSRVEGDEGADIAFLCWLVILPAFAGIASLFRMFLS